MNTGSQRNPYTASQANVGEPQPRASWFYGRGRFGNVLIPSHPVVGMCEHCREERNFRLFVQTDCTHLLTMLQWNFKSTFFRICGECDHAYKLSYREIRAILPTYRPPAPNIVQNSVFLMTWGVFFAFVVYELIRRIWPF